MSLPRVADALAEMSARLAMPICFKASFDKANRARAGGCSRARASTRGCAPWSGSATAPDFRS